MERTDLIAKMRTRVAQCRQLADATDDPRIAETLRGMAAEGEADIERLLKADASGVTGNPEAGPPLRS